MSKTVTLKGNQLTLKPPTQDDYDLLKKIKPCDEFYLMFGSNPAESKFNNAELFDSSFTDSLNRENYWNAVKDAEIIGVAFLHSLDSNDRHARYAVGIYNKANWNQGFGQQITNCVLDYAFTQLKLHKVDLRVLAYNTRAIAGYKKTGFIEEGRLRENAFINNRWHDDIIMSILSREFFNRKTPV